MSRECAARFADKWEHLNQLIKESETVNNPEHQAIRICITGDVALFEQHDPDLARKLYNQAIKLVPSIFDARLRLACMALFEEGRIMFNNSGYLDTALENLATVVFDEAYMWLQPIKLPGQSTSLKFAKELSQMPYRWLLLVQSICLRALLEEQKGDVQAAYENYSGVWDKIITPVFPAVAMPSSTDALPDILSTDCDRIRQVSNVSVAVLAGRCRALLRMGRHREFLDLARNSCQLNGPLMPVPRVQLGLCHRFAETLIFYHSSLNQLYNDERIEKKKRKFRSPFEEAILLLWITLERIHSEHPDLEADLGTATRSTARLLLSLCDQFIVIADLYRDEIALNISNHELWFIRSLALACSESYSEAYQAVKLAIRLQPKRIEQLLFASKLLLNHLSNSKRSLKLAEDALMMCSQAHPFFVICHFICGAASGRLAYQVWTFSRRKQLQQEGLQHSIHAGNCQPKNQKYVFSIAAIQADIREINLALRLAKHSLSLNSSHFESWHLMALLLSSQKLYQQALQVCAAGASECHPSYHLNFLLTRCKILVGRLLSEDLHLSDQILLIGQAFEVFQSLFSDGLVNPLQLKLVDVGPYHSCPVLFRASDLDAPITTTQQAIHAKSQTLQNYCSPAFKYEDPDSLQHRAVLALVDLYAFIARTPALNASDTIPIALSCLDYLIGLGSASWFPDIYVKIGQLSEQTADDSSAVTHYELALSFDGQHTEALVRIGALHKKMQKTVIAHEYLLNALRIDSTMHGAWLEIGHILHSQGKFDAACEAITTALELERTAPVETFYSVMRHA